ncbi:MAG: hypothetical protein ACYCUM_11240 [Solirubrobacteraceae bacterium]
MALTDGQSIDLAAARLRLSELRARRRDLHLTATIMLAAAGALAGLPSYVWAGACALGAVLALLLAGQSAGDRRRLLTRLVSQGDAQALPEVQEFSRWLTSMKERRRLQRALRAAAAAGGGGPASEFTMIRAERAEGVTERLRAVADVVGDSSTPVSALGLALCRRLLFDPASSPLLNPKFAAKDAERAILTVQARLDCRD